MQALPGWPSCSPDFNPQENVWSWVEEALREKERASDTFKVLVQKLLGVARRYPRRRCFDSLYVKMQGGSLGGPQCHDFLLVGRGAVLPGQRPVEDSRFTTLACPDPESSYTMWAQNPKL